MLLKFGEDILINLRERNVFVIYMSYSWVPHSPGLDFRWEILKHMHMQQRRQIPREKEMKSGTKRMDAWQKDVCQKRGDDAIRNEEGRVFKAK